MAVIIDSVTKQEIKDDTPVVLILLVNGSSQNNDIGLMARPSERMKMASLPIHGTWTDVGFEVRDENSVAVQSVLRAFDKDGQNFSDLLASLWSDSTLNVEKPSWNCSNKKEYAIFVTKEDSLLKVANTTSVMKYVGKHDVNADFELIKSFTDKYSAAVKAFDEIRAVGGDEFETYDQKRELLKVLQLAYTGRLEPDDGDRVPYAAKSLARSSETPFSTELLKTLGGDHYLGPHGVLSPLTFDDNPVLPDFYEELFRSAHEGVSIFHSLNVLDIPMAPAMFAQSGFRDTSKMELLGQVLAECIREHVQECRSYSDDPVKEIDRLISPLKSCVADALRERNSIPNLER
jgi:hypothetical protein